MSSSTKERPSGPPEASFAAGVTWSAVSMLALRLGNMTIGIVLARLLSKPEFGVYAVALTVLAGTMALADFGLTADLIRCKDPEKKAPTVGALSLVTNVLMASTMFVFAGQLAGLLGAPGATATTRVLALTLVIGGAGVVPYAMLLRRFQQKVLFAIAVVDFVLSTALTLLLLWLGFGVVSIAWGRVLGQISTTTLHFLAAGMRPQYRFDRDQVRPVVSFGLPLAGANLLNWGVLSLDTMIVSRTLGPAALAAYSIAFNVANWPMSALGDVLRNVALPALSRTRSTKAVVAAGSALAWTLALPAAGVLAVVSVPLVVFLYTDKYADSPPALAVLALFGALRVLFDLWSAALLAVGRSRTAFVIDGTWFVLLVPGVWYGAQHGITGAAVAHLLVSAIFIVPLYLWQLGRAGLGPRDVLRGITASTVRGVAVIGATAAVVVLTMNAWHLNHLVVLVAAAVTAGAVLVATSWTSAQGQIARLRELTAPEGAQP